jgi:spermidine synthase
VAIGPDGAPRSIRLGKDAGRAALLVDGIVQSISPTDGLAAGGYWAAMVPEDRPRTALILGLGGGTLARLLQARWLDVEMVGVDDDAPLLALATRIGWLPGPDDGLRIVVGDAFAYLREPVTERFEFIAVDLFRGGRLDGRIFGKPVLRQIRARLIPRGRVAVNLFKDRHAAERITRLAAFFDIRAEVPVGGNVVVHARRRR